MKTKTLTVRVPAAWWDELVKIGQPIERDPSYLTRDALKRCYPTLKGRETLPNESGSKLAGDTDVS